MKRISSDYTIKPFDTVVSLFGEAQDRDHESLKNNETYMQFMKESRKIHWVGKNNGVPAGDVLLLIYRKFDFNLDNCPWCRFDEVYHFVVNNIDQRYKYIYPEMHAFLLKTDYYNQSSTAVAKPAFVSGVMKTLYHMMKNKAPRENFEKFGIELSKI